MRHGAARRSATSAGFADVPPALYTVIGATEFGVSDFADGYALWTSVPLPAELQNIAWRDWCYGSKGYLFVGPANVFGVSENGRSVSSTPAPVNGKTWVGCAYSPTLDLYLIVASDGVNYRSSSPTGPWTAGTTFSGSLTVESVKWLTDKFIMIASVGTNRFRYSTNGTTWTNITETGIGTGVNYGIAKLSTGRFILGQANAYRWTDNAALTGWTNVSITSAGQLRHIIDTPTRFIIYSEGSTSIRRVNKTNMALQAQSVASALVGRGLYNPDNNNTFLMLNQATLPTRHVQFYPDPTGNLDLFYAERYAASMSKLWMSPVLG